MTFQKYTVNQDNSSPGCFAAKSCKLFKDGGKTQFEADEILDIVYNVNNKYWKRYKINGIKGLKEKKRGV